MNSAYSKRVILTRKKSSEIFCLFDNAVAAGVSIVNNAPSAEHGEDKHHSNCTVLFAGGAAVQVAERQGLLHEGPNIK